MNENWQATHSSAREICRLFELPDSFLEDLLQGDDWTYIIRLHALLETAITWALEIHLQPHPIGDFLARLNFAGRGSSKLELAEQLGILDQDSRKYVSGINTIRNRLAHNIRHLRFDLARYVEDLSEEHRRQFVSNCCALVDPKIAADTLKEERVSNIPAPKLILWAEGILVVATILEKTRLKLPPPESGGPSQASLQQIVDSIFGMTARMRAADSRRSLDAKIANLVP